jgi:ABC-type uncharacterized transport system permease subunit
MSELLQIVALGESTLRLAVPLVLAALAGLFAERSGIIDIALEGKMLAAAFAGAAAASLTGSASLGLLAAMLASLSLALLHGYASITHHGNQVVSGMALNLFVAGLAPTLAAAWFGQGGDTPALPPAARIDLNLFLVATLVIVALVAAIVYGTRFGLRLRAVGENPQAVDTAGISVQRQRYLGLCWTGVLCGLAGADLSLALNAGFVRDMTAGRGYIALAALIMGKWRPLPAAAACLLFAFADALEGRLQGTLPGIPVQLVAVLPYILTVLVLAGFIGKARAPKAIGVPYMRTR